VSDSTLPQKCGLHSHATAGIGIRAHHLHGRGSDYAKLVWLIILSHTRYPGRPPREPWATDVTLAHETGIGVHDLREVQRGLQRLRDAGLITTPIGRRPGARRPTGRVLVPQLGAPARVLIPDRHEMAQLWARCREFRKRPAFAVTAMVGAYALACDAADHRIDDWSPLGCTQSEWRRFVGAAKGGGWRALVSDLDRAGLIRRDGRAIDVAPPRSWLWTLDLGQCDHGPAPPLAA